MFQRSESEPSQKQEKKNEVKTRKSVEQSCALRSVVGRVSSTVWPLETVMNLNSFCMIFVGRGMIENVEDGEMNQPTSSSGRRTTRPSMKLCKKNVKLTRTSIMKEGVKIRPAEWCSSGNWRVRGQPWTFSGLHRAVCRRCGFASKTKLSNNLDVLQVELRTHRCSSLCRRSEEGAGDEGDNIARLLYNALCFGLRIGAALCC